MSHTLQISLTPDLYRPVVFPDRCVCCGATREAESTLALNRFVMRGKRQEAVTLKYQIPHCRRCARSTKTVFLAGCIPFVLGFLVVGLAVFLIVTYGASIRGLDSYGQPNNSNSVVLGAAAGLFAGIVGGFLFEVMARIILLPVMGRGLLAAPLLALQLLDDSDYVAGLRGKLESDASSVHFSFANDDVAREFRSLNGAEN
ncbi:MAG: hypothetical protein ND895_00185 [Pyrinomonadaceae bacterium]|nr:hypothetical protein [Pyrinomonadaceae bacterium]